MLLSCLFLRHPTDQKFKGGQLCKIVFAFGSTKQTKKKKHGHPLRADSLLLEYFFFKRDLAYRTANSKS